MFIPCAILVGLYITVGHFFVDAKRRESTIYGITTERIIIRSGFFSKTVHLLNIKSLSEISFQEEIDDSGTIILMRRTDFLSSMMQEMGWPKRYPLPRLELIENVKAVYDKILNLQR